jgi:hypothetical protein
MSYIGKNVAPQPQGTYSQSEIDTQMLTKAPTDSPVFTGNGITIPVLSSDPSGAVPGQMYYNSTDKGIKNYNGTAWDLMTNRFSAIGGTVTEVNGYRIHTFTSSGTFTVLSSGTVEYLIVAGGGGTGYDVGGGGGGGGLLYNQAYPIFPGTYYITIGAGGGSSQQVNTAGFSGSNSTFGILTAIGGGGGGSYNEGEVNGLSGGSGGGGGDSSASGGSGTVGQGHAGGSSASSEWGSGAGGGAGGAGPNGSKNNNVSGGAGLMYDISGSYVYYAGGGYGNYDSGAVYSTGRDLNDIALGYYGYGANGTGSPNNSPYSGNSGIVIIRYPL